MNEIMQLIAMGGTFAGALIGATGFAATVERSLAGRKLRIKGEAGFAAVEAQARKR
jgi:hypothetical protein